MAEVEPASRSDQLPFFTLLSFLFICILYQRRWLRIFIFFLCLFCDGLVLYGLIALLLCEGNKLLRLLAWIEGYC